MPDTPTPSAAEIEAFCWRWANGRLHEEMAADFAATIATLTNRIERLDRRHQGDLLEVAEETGVDGPQMYDGCWRAIIPGTNVVVKRFPRVSQESGDPDGRAACAAWIEEFNRTQVEHSANGWPAQVATLTARAEAEAVIRADMSEKLHFQAARAEAAERANSGFAIETLKAAAIAKAATEENEALAARVAELEAALRQLRAMWADDITHEQFRKAAFFYIERALAPKEPS